MHDVEFHVNNTKIGAHKLILAINSPVFNEMFRDKACDGKFVIEIVDFHSADAFREFLKFIYLEEADITMENVFPMIYLSKKYGFPTLELICSSYVVERVSIENVSEFLDYALKLNQCHIEDACNRILCQNCMALITNGSFFNIGHEALTYILGQEHLSVSENDLATAVLRWCQEEVNRRSQLAEAANEESRKPDRRTLRSVIGESLYLVRFPCMDEGNFAATIAYSGLLSLKEVRDVYSFFAYQRMLHTSCDEDLKKKLKLLIAKMPFPVERRKSVDSMDDTIM